MDFFIMTATGGREHNLVVRPPVSPPPPTHPLPNLVLLCCGCYNKRSLVYSEDPLYQVTGGTTTLRPGERRELYTLGSKYLSPCVLFRLLGFCLMWMASLMLCMASLVHIPEFSRLPSL